MDEVIETVRKTIRKNRLLQKRETVIAAVSGGCDSVFLLRSLFLLRDNFRIELKVAHLNHMLREEEAERDAEFVKGLCRELSVDCHLESRDVKAFAEKHSLSLEEGARMCRYDFFESVRQNAAADKIALGHTADDQAETLLLRLFRGSGITGLASMAVKREHIVRPLLNLRRSEIREYLEREGFPYVDDSSNLDMRFRRNIIRHKVIPMIESHINRSVVPVLARTASVLSEEDAVLDARAQKDLKRVSRQNGENIRLDTEPILRMPAARRRRVLRAAVDEVKGDLRNISSAHIDRVLELIHSGSAGSKIDLHSLEVYRDYDSILLGRNLSSFAPEYEERVIVPGVTEVKEVGLALLSSFVNWSGVKLKTPEKDRAYFDFDELLLPLSVRNRRPGDRIAPFGQRKPKKLKKLLIDDKLSRRVRDAAPIIVDGGGILWMPGGRRSGRAVVTPKTERILCIEARKSSY